MSNNRKMTVPAMMNDINQVHEKEKSQFPSDVATLAPARNYVADKLIKANILKNFQEDLYLFDCYKHEDEVKLRDEIRKVGKFLNHSYFITPTLFSLIYLKYKRVPLLQLNSYINHLTPLLVVFGVNYLGVSLTRKTVASANMNIFSNDLDIYNAKATLHTIGVKLANSLKYPDNELH